MSTTTQICMKGEGDNLHEMSNPVFWENYEKYLKMSAENFTKSAKH